MTSEKQLRLEVDEKNAALVLAVLKKASKPLYAHEIAKTLGLGIATTSAALSRLRHRQQAKSRGVKGTVMVWMIDAPTKPATERHVPGNQPNGSPEFWASHMAEMNAPARRELQG